MTLIEMELFKIIIDEKRAEQIIVLKEKHGERQLPIVIGILEATAIKMRLSGAIPPRPLTHDLLEGVVRALNATVTRVVIDRFEEGTFFAKLCLETHDGLEQVVDARPSDSIAVAVRVKAPLFVAEDVLKKVEFPPQEN
jgi:bifunctional DNase/RNase